MNLRCPFLRDHRFIVRYYTSHPVIHLLIPYYLYNTRSLVHVFPFQHVCDASQRILGAEQYTRYHGTWYAILVCDTVVPTECSSSFDSSYS